MIGHCYHGTANVLINTETQPETPAANLDSAITTLRAARDGAMLSLALFTRGYNASAVFDFGEARRWLSEAVVAGDSVGCRFAIAWAKRFLSLVSWQFGDKRSSVEDFLIAKRIFTMLNDRFALGNIAAAEGSVALEMGSWMRPRPFSAVDSPMQSAAGRPKECSFPIIAGGGEGLPRRWEEPVEL
jgi:hypothetical protein